MGGKGSWSMGAHGGTRRAGILAGLLAGIIGGAAALAGAAGSSGTAGRGAGAPSGPGATTTATGADTAPATGTGTAPASAPALRPAIAADTILKGFPQNANVVRARSDARNFSVEGRVGDVRTVSLDKAGNALAPGSAGGETTELRVTLVGRGQADDVAAHFTCRFDKATEDAARQLKADQIVRLTGTISGTVPAGDRIDLVNCHDLQETGPLNVGDQLVGAWRCNGVQVDGAALRKASTGRGSLPENVPEATYTAPWHIDLVLRADGTMAAELAEDSGASLKRLTGRCLVVKDGPTEARVRLSVQGTGSQDTTATMEGGRLKMSLPGLADKFVLPEMKFEKVDGTLRPMDYRALKDQTLQWVAGNLARPDNNLPKVISDVIDQAASQQQGFVFTLGAGMVLRGRVEEILGAYGKLIPLEYSDAETRASGVQGMTVIHGQLPQWGTLMTPEVKIESVTVDNRAAFDPTKPATGKMVLRGLRRTIDTQYVLVTEWMGGMHVMPIEKPGSDAQNYDLALGQLPGGSAGPRPVLFMVGRQAKANDPFGGNGNRVISDPAPMILEVVPGK